VINTEIAEILTIELKRLSRISKKLHNSSVLDEIETTSTNLEYALRLFTPRDIVDAYVNSLEEEKQIAA